MDSRTVGSHTCPGTRDLLTRAPVSARPVSDALWCQDVEPGGGWSWVELAEGFLSAHGSKHPSVAAGGWQWVLGASVGQPAEAAALAFVLWNVSAWKKPV